MDELATYLSENMVLSSPFIQHVFPETKDSKLVSKEHVMRYWRKVNAEHFMHLRLNALTRRVKKITCEIQIDDTASIMQVTFLIDQYGKFTEMDIRYPD